jgi:hypothetical protein
MHLSREMMHFEMEDLSSRRVDCTRYQAWRFQWYNNFSGWFFTVASECDVMVPTSYLMLIQNRPPLVV